MACPPASPQACARAKHRMTWPVPMATLASVLNTKSATPDSSPDSLHSLRFKWSHYQPFHDRWPSLTEYEVSFIRSVPPQLFKLISVCFLDVVRALNRANMMRLGKNATQTRADIYLDEIVHFNDQAVHG